jgi:hypothetical protein
MTTKTLSFLFDAMLHGKYEFDDFLHGDVTKNYDAIQAKGRTIGFPKLFRTPRIGAMMHPEVRDGEASLQPRVQA